MSEELARCINPQPGGPKLIMDWIPQERRKKNVDGRSTSSHDNKKLRNRSMEKQRGMAFGFRKTATAVKKTGQTDRLCLFPRSG